MQTARNQGLKWLAGLTLALALAVPKESYAQELDPQLFMVRLQLEPGALLARQNGPLTLGLNSIGLTGSLAVGFNVGQDTAVGVEGWFGMALLPSLDITAPDYDGAGPTVEVKGPTMTALLVGPHVTRVFAAEAFSLSATFGVAAAQFDYESYDDEQLPYNRSNDTSRPPEDRKDPIPLDKTGLGWGFGVAVAKLIPLSDGLSLGVGAHFRYLLVPDDAIYRDDRDTIERRFQADSWSITTFGLDASITYF